MKEETALQLRARLHHHRAAAAPDELQGQSQDVVVEEPDSSPNGTYDVGQSGCFCSSSLHRF